VIGLGKAKKIPTTRVGKGRRRNFGELRSDFYRAKSVPILFMIKINNLLFLLK
jgi:hypothetical protein